MISPTVSVLMTAYNREDYIAEAIESVLASTYTDFELIITDDGSTDSTVEIVRTYAAKDTRIKLFLNPKNLGDYVNRNKAASYATGKYLKYLDADDYIYPWGLELLVKIMEQFPSAGWGLCSLEPNVQKWFPFELTPSEVYRYHYFGPGLFHKAPLSSIIRRDAFESVGGFSGKQHLGDFELWHLLALKHSLILMPHGIVWYRNHENQQSKDNRTDPKIQFKYSVAGRNFLRARPDIIPLEKSEIDKIVKTYNTYMFKKIIRYITRGKIKDARNLFLLTRSNVYDFK